MDVIFFKDKVAFRRWLSAHHDRVDEQWVGYYKKKTGHPSITWPESVDEALCFGWIDGLRKSIDEERYRIRFTPRRPGSNWSRINIERVQVLSDLGRMKPAGLRAFENRKTDKTGYSYEQGNVELRSDFLTRLKAVEAAWKFFNDLSPGSRKQSIHWVMSAKREETRLRRLEVLIDCSAKNEKIPPLNISRKNRS